MTEKTINDHIADIAQDEIQKIPKTTTCEIIKNYTNEPSKVDVTTQIGELRYIDCLNSNAVGRKGVVIFPDGTYDNPIAIIETRSLTE